MKKIEFLFVAIILFMSSCQKDDSFYSCDPNINSWIKSHLTEIGQMSRNDLIVKKPSVQVAIFRAFSSSQRFQLWNDKIDEVLELGWSDQEQSHILTLRVTLKEEWFTDEFKRDSLKSQQVHLFLKNWCLEGMARFGWTKKLIGGMVARTERLTNKQGTLETNGLESTRAAIATDSEDSCNCNQSDDWCPQVGGSGRCKNETCSGSSWGCGTLWLDPCNGICRLF